MTDEQFDGLARALNQVDLLSTDRLALAKAAIGYLEAEGMVIVPRVPTRAMLDAGYISNAVDSDGEGGFWLDGEAPAGIWQAMLAAAPKQP